MRKGELGYPKEHAQGPAGRECDSQDSRAALAGPRLESAGHQLNSHRGCFAPEIRSRH